MPTSVVAHRYASAFADVVTAPGSGISPEAALAEICSFEDAMRSSPELSNALVTPSIPSARKKVVIGRIAEVLKLSRVSRNFLFVLVDRRRIASVPQIIRSLEQVLDERLGFARAEVISARDLTDDQRGVLAAKLERITGKRIRMQIKIDESLIGGAVARVGSTVYDGSVRGQLQSLERRMAAADIATSS
jgi:F-type H+-transporting ATPase subunit delta